VEIMLDPSLSMFRLLPSVFGEYGDDDKESTGVHDGSGGGLVVGSASRPGEEEGDWRMW